MHIVAAVKQLNINHYKSKRPTSALAVEKKWTVFILESCAWRVISTTMDFPSTRLCICFFSTREQTFFVEFPFFSYKHGRAHRHTWLYDLIVGICFSQITVCPAHSRLNILSALLCRSDSIHTLAYHVVSVQCRPLELLWNDSTKLPPSQWQIWFEMERKNSPSDTVLAKLGKRHSWNDHRLYSIRIKTMAPLIWAVKRAEEETCVYVWMSLQTYNKRMNNKEAHSFEIAS